MADYISREAVKEYLKRAIFGADSKIDKWVDAIPAADVKPVVRGMWVPGREIARTMLANETVAVEYEDWHCSECGAVVEDWEFPRYKFCPACGADMREVQG